MRPEILSILRCPNSGTRLGLEAKRVEGDQVIEGTLRAEGGRFTYPIIDGVPNLLPSPTTGRRTRGAFNLQWERSMAGLEGEDVLYGYPLADATGFMAQTVLPPAGDKDAWILDAGCGTAERSVALARRGHPVLAFDLSDTVRIAFRRHRDVSGLHLVQADVLHPPVAPASIDTVICIGVLHHTPDARGGLGKLARLQRPDGRMLVWLYPRDRRRVDPFLGKLYRLRDMLRVVHKLPPRGVWAVSVLAATGLYPFFSGRFRALRRASRVGSREIWGSILMNTYDFLAPPFQSRHTQHEVADWFEAEGYAQPERAGTGFYFSRKISPSPDSRHDPARSTSPVLHPGHPHDPARPSTLNL